MPKGAFFPYFHFEFANSMTKGVVSKKSVWMARKGRSCVLNKEEERVCMTVHKCGVEEGSDRRMGI